MLRISNLGAAIGGATLFMNLSFALGPGDRLGVIGPNGAGKTTLLRIIAGEIAPVAGRVDLGGIGRVARLAQLQDGAGEAETAGGAHPGLFGSEALEGRLVAIAEELAKAPGPHAAMLEAQYDEIVTRLALAGSRDGDDLLPAGVGADSRLVSLSGGERQRLALAATLREPVELLLLDEPTNHLDLDAIDVLERRLEGFEGAVILVSHDRALLDNVATHILALSPGVDSPVVFTGGYSDFAADAERRLAGQWDAYERQQREERALRRNISAIESRARNTENKTIHFYFRKRAKKVARRAVTLRARLEREAASSEHVERPAKRPPSLEGRFVDAAPGASTVLTAERVDLDAGGRRLLSNATFSVSRGDRVALLGPNGSGKTTLMRAILRQHPVAGGELRLAPSAIAGVIDQHDDADLFAGASETTAVDWLRREAAVTRVEAGNVLHRFLATSAAVETPLSRLSPGERRRLALARLILRGTNLLLLDEPTNHLDLPAREAFEDAFAGYEGAVVFATHDRYFIERLATRVLVIEGGRLVEVPLEAVE